MRQLPVDLVRVQIVQFQAQSRQANAATPKESPQENGGALHLGRDTPDNQAGRKRQWNQVTVTESCVVMRLGNTLYLAQPSRD